MKNTFIFKLAVIAIIASMTLALFACGDNETVTTGETESEQTETTTTSGDNAKDTTDLTENDKTETTEETTNETTEATTAEEKSSTETDSQATESVGTEAATDGEFADFSPETGVGYYLSLVQKNLKKTLYLGGECVNGMVPSVEYRGDAVRVYLEAVDGGYHMYHVANGEKVYINLAKGSKGAEIAFGEAESVWTYNARLGTLIAKLDGQGYFLGMRNDKLDDEFCALKEEHSANFKAMLTLVRDGGEVKCYHDMIATEGGHYFAACAICGAAKSDVEPHFFTNMREDGDEYAVLSIACQDCEYVIYSCNVANNVNRYISALQLMHHPTYAYTCTLEKEDDLVFARYSSASAGHINIWAADGENGAGIPRELQANTGRYLVLKIRVTGELKALYIKATTSDTLSSQSREPYVATGEWQVIVLDMSSFEGYECGADGKSVQIRLDPWDAAAGYTVDIAYAAIIDTVEEISGFVSDEICTLYHNWAGDGFEINVATGGCIEHTYVESFNDNKYTYACTICGMIAFEKSVDEKVNKYVSAGIIVSGNVDSELVVKDGAAYAAITSRTINILGAADGSEVELGANTGKYLVVRYRTNDVTAMTLSVSVNGGAISSVKKACGKDAGWESAVVDLSSLDGYVTDTANATVKLCISLEGGNSCGIDIAYVAIIDSIDEVSGVIEEPEFAYYADWTLGAVMLKTENGECVKHDYKYETDETSHKAIECRVCGKPGDNVSAEHTFKEMEVSEDIATVYSNACEVCGRSIWSYRVPHSVNMYVGADYVLDQPVGAWYNTTNGGKHNDENTVFGRINGVNNIGQIFWTRMGRNPANNEDWPAFQLNPINVNGGRYMVIKTRTNDTDIGRVEFMFGTIKNEGTYANYDTMTVATCNLPYASIKQDEWTTFVIDLTAADFAAGWQPATDGSDLHILVYLQFTFYNSGNSMLKDTTNFDISYMAICDDWTEIDALVDTPDVVLVTNRSGAHTTLNKNGSCKESHAIVETVTGNVYTYKCSICNTEIASKTVDEDINKFIPLGTMTGNTHFMVSNAEIQVEDGLAYAHFFAAEPCHINLWSEAGASGAGAPTPLGANTGRYFVIKLRSENVSRLGLHAGTNGNMGDFLGYPGTQGTADGSWQVIVIDLNNVDGFDCNSDASTPTQVRINGYGTNLTYDVAYCAFVDTLGEASMLITEDTFTYYDGVTSFENDGGVVYSTATAQPLS